MEVNFRCGIGAGLGNLDYIRMFDGIVPYSYPFLTSLSSIDRMCACCEGAKAT